MLMILIPLLVLLLVIGGAYWLIKRKGSSEGTDPALEELRTQYARGDIDEEEFERRRDRLQR